MAQSATEAEFIVATATVNQTLWKRRIFFDLHMEQKFNTEVHVDNQVAIDI